MLQKYFIAIVPPEPLMSKIMDVKTAISQSYGTKGALRSPGHITLHMPFSFEEGKEDKLITCLQSFRFVDSFSVSLNNYGCFEPRVVFINVKEEKKLLELQTSLVKHVRKHLQLFNQVEDMRGFHPHITVAFRDLKKQVFYKIWDEYQAKLFSASFECRSIALLKHEKDHWNVFREFDFSGPVV